ncbi:MAG: hypothetical protein GC154_02590 [bacterium]|nr:hypothetical protein [bacterium]
MRLMRAFLRDPISWGLLFSLCMTLAACASMLVHRYDRVDQYKLKLYQLECDLVALQLEKDQKDAWLERLQTDPSAWEQVAREKMNYLGPDEVLVTFAPQ